MSNERYPNLFILGAPKCGTTAMSSYLAGHPDIFMAEQGGMKEPRFFCDDLWYRGNSTITSKNEYLKLFESAPSSTKYLGEATPRYLQSVNAVPEILRVCEKPRFVVMLRNPVDIVNSQHNQRVKEGCENTDLETAWRLQYSRLHGKSLPPGVLDGRFVYYSMHAMLGKQIRCLLSHVDENDIYYIFFSDLKKNSGKSYRKLLEFLELPDDGREDFSTANSSVTPRSVGLNNTLQRMVRLRQRLGIGGLGIARFVSRFNSTPGREPMRPEFRRELQQYFKDDIDLLSELTGRDLSHWYTA